LSRVAHGSVVAHYDIDGPLPGGCLILLAVVEPSVSVVVNAGENAGRTLRHTNVVRSLTVSPLRTPSGEQVATIPWDAAPGEAEVVAVVQRADGPRAMAVLGAAQSAI
jgi:hypothetical protein